ncbi:MAG TPA: hypothetical protein HA221_02255 [Halobacteria archaeon]|nr:hypothetical protein [Halobacteria archaeon]
MDTTSKIILVLFLVFILRWIVIYLLDRKGILERHNISTIGPILMFKTYKGQHFLEKIARPKRFWRGFASVGIPLVFAAMVFMFVLFLRVAMITFTQPPPPPNPLTSPRNIFLIPGLNTYIPLVEGIIGLAVTLLIHEFAHAILAKVEGVKVKSLALLTIIVPIGAATEIDEDELFGKPNDEKDENDIKDIEINKDNKDDEARPKKIAKSGERVRILSAGVISNFFIAFIAFLLFFGPVLGSIAPINEGVAVSYTMEGFPAANAGIGNGEIIKSMNDQEIATISDFFNYMEGTAPGDRVLIVTNDGEYDIILAKNPENPNKGYLGLSVYDIGGSLNSIKNLPRTLGTLGGWLVLYGLPLMYMGFLNNLATFYVPVGFASLFGNGFFWIARILLWVGWINLVAGLFNSLPATPLDGGYILRETLLKAFNKVTKDKERAERMSHTVVNFMGILVAISILSAILWQSWGYI